MKMEWWRTDNPEHDHWKPIEDEKEKKLWERTFSVLEFDVGRRPRIKYVEPFLCWSTLHLMNSSGSYEELYDERSDYYIKEHETREYLFTLFLKIHKKYKEFFALDFEHEGYQFEPNWGNPSKTSWPISFIPDGSVYMLFVTDNLDCGFYCDPRDKSVFMFGEFLFSIFDYNKMPCRGKILQSSFPKLGGIPR